MGLAPHHIMTAMQQVLSFIAAREREIASTALVSGRSADASSIDIRPFRDLQALVRYMSDKSAALLASAQSGGTGGGGGGGGGTYRKR